MGVLLVVLNVLGALLFFPLLLLATIELQKHILISNVTHANELSRALFFLLVPQISVSLAMLFNAIFSAWQSLYTKSVAIGQYMKTSYSFAAITIWSLALYLSTLNTV